MMQRRAFLLGAAATGLVPLSAQAAPLDLRARVRAWRSRWQRDGAARRAEVGLPAGDAAVAAGAALAAGSVIEEVGTLEVEEQVHPAVQGLLRDLVDAVEGAAAAGADTLARWRVGAGRDDAEAARLGRALRRANRRRWVDRDTFGVGRAGSAASVRRRVRRAERAARRLSLVSARGRERGAPLDPALAARIEAGQARYGVAEPDDGTPRSASGRRRGGMLAVSVLLVVGGVLCISWGTDTLWLAWVPVLGELIVAGGLGLILVGVLMLVAAAVVAVVAFLPRGRPAMAAGPDLRWGTLGADPEPRAVTLHPGTDFWPTQVVVGRRTPVVVGRVGSGTGGTLHARVGEVELVVPPSGCLPPKAAGPLSLRVDGPSTLEPQLLQVRLAERGECP